MMLGDGVAPVVEMLRQGVNVALGSDGAASNHCQDLFETMKVTSLLQKVHHLDAGIIEPYAVLRMATAGGAQALGLSSICGTIEIGKRADLILVHLEETHTQPVNDLFSQLVHCTKASDVHTTIVNGDVLMNNRELTLVDEKQVLDLLKVTSLLQKVHHLDAGIIEPYAVLRMATAGGAQALGLSSICGTIEIGKRADLILVHLEETHTQPVNDLFSQLVHCTKASDVHTTIVNGDVLMNNRELTLVDEKQVLEEAKKANTDLTERLRTLPG